MVEEVRHTITIMENVAILKAQLIEAIEQKLTPKGKQEPIKLLR